VVDLDLGSIGFTLILIVIPLSIFGFLGYTIYQNEMSKINTLKNIQIYLDDTPIEYIEWYDIGANQIINANITIMNIGETSTKIAMINTPELNTYNIKWDYKRQKIGINQTIPVVISLITLPEFQSQIIKTQIEVT